MKKVLKLAKIELSILFYSPIAWLLLIIFIIQSGVTFTDILYSRETTQQLGGNLSVLTKVLFAGDKGLLADVQQKLYLYIPLLTMGLMSRETSSGSIKLLFSSPVFVRQIIFGKFLAMVAYALILVAVLLIITGVAYFSIEALDVKFVLGGILGLFLLTCSYAAIGLFMSCLTSYQVVAAISTLAVLAGLNFVGQLGQSYDFVRDITYWISISGRCDNFINGLISSKDIIYFLLVIGLFLTLCIMKLNAGRKFRTGFARFTRYATVIIGVMAVGYISSLPPLTTYFDTTRFKDRTLTKESQDLVQQLKHPLLITTYTNAVHYKAPYGAPKHRIADIQQFEQYQRFLPDLKIEYIPYYDTVFYQLPQGKTVEEVAKRAATAHGFDFSSFLTPAEIKKKIDLTPEENMLVRVVSYEGKTTFLRMFDDMFVYPKEAEISAAIKRLLVEPPVVGMLTGHEERSVDKTGDKSYKNSTKGLSIRSALINQGFDVHNIDLKDSLPASLSVLVIADPLTPYSAAETAKIQAYLADGGNMLIACEPGRQDRLNPLIETLGISFKKGQLLEESKDFEVDLLQTLFTPQAAENGFKFREKSIVSLPGTVGINLKDSTLSESSGYTITPILRTNEKTSWNTRKTIDLNNEKVVFDPATDQKASYTVAAMLTKPYGNKEQKIMVIGDADFMSNAELDRYNLNTQNANFTTRLFKWFSNGAFPINTSRPASIDTKVTVDRGQIAIMKTILLGVFPGILALLGAGLLIRRKSQ